MNFNFDVNTITQALRDGSTQEEIANNFAAILNKAAATVKTEKAKKAEEARKNAEIQKKKLQHAQLVADFYNTYYYNDMPDEVKLTAQDVIDTCDSAIGTFKKLFSSVTSPKNSVENPLLKIFNL